MNANSAETKNPFFSVIIPAHNAAPTLGKCLASIKAQTLPASEFEVMVIDDRSTDGTAAVAAAHGVACPRGSFSSIGAARNRGAALARGRVLAFIDADVTADPRWLERAKGYFSSGFCGALSFADEAPGDAGWIGHAWNSRLRNGRSRLHEPDHLNSRNILVNREIHCAIGGFDEELFAGGKAGEDKEYSYHIKAHGWKLLSDPSLDMIHLGFERSLGELLRKEFWRQGHMLHIARKHGYPMRLVRNSLFGFGHACALALAVAGIMRRNHAAAFGALTAWSLPSLALLARNLRGRAALRLFPGLWLLTALRWTVAGLSVPGQALAILIRPRR